MGSSITIQTSQCVSDSYSSETENGIEAYKLFNAGLTRKDSNGKLKAFDKKHATPVVAVSLDDYATHEKWVIAELEQNEKKLREKQTSFPGI